MKLLPMLILAGGVATVGTQGQKIVDRVLDKVKVLVTGMEVMSIADEVRFYFLSNGSVPGDDDVEEWQAFLRENFTASWGNRDPAIDFFGNFYELADGDGNDADGELERVILSLGPNGVWDSCALVNGEKQPPQVIRIDAEMAKAQEDLAEGEEGEEWEEVEEELEVTADDICVSLEFALRDTPFRGL